MKNDKKQRRGFLKAALAVVAATALAKVVVPSSPKEIRKIKMLTPDGQLVEVDEAIITKAGAAQKRASNKEVKQWMKTNKV